MAMVGYLTHHIVDDKLRRAVFMFCHEGERIDHELLLFIGGYCAMLPQYGHRCVAGIAIENRELERRFELAIPRSVVFQLAEITLGHRPPDCDTQSEKVPHA